MLVGAVFHGAARTAINHLQVHTVCALTTGDNSAAAKSLVVGGEVLITVARKGAACDSWITERSEVVLVCGGDITAHTADA